MECIVTVPQLSAVVGPDSQRRRCTGFASAGRVTSPWQVSVQAAPLVTVTVKLQETVLFGESFDESVAVQLTVVVPTLKFEPEGGLQTVVTQLPVVPAGAG